MAIFTISVIFISFYVRINESTTTRTAGGLDFTAIGGKRQGREVPQSLKTTRFGKPDHPSKQAFKASLSGSGMLSAASRSIISWKAGIPESCVI